jgi:hypothetical protein
MVAMLSSAARIPLPGAINLAAVRRHIVIGLKPFSYIGLSL